MSRPLLLFLSVAVLAGAGCDSSATPPVLPARIEIQEEQAVVEEKKPEEPAEQVYTPVKEFTALRFTIPQGMEVEYVDSIKSLNVYAIEGNGTTLDRSQIFIRFFDADRFLTLSTVKIHSVTDLSVSAENYVARQYDIEKRSGVPDFPGQPVWRNARHIVTDTRKNSGFTRYYVIAKNPGLDPNIYNVFLTGLEIVE